MAASHDLRRLLLNHLIDDRAKTTPGDVWAEIPKSNESYDQGFRWVTYGDFSNAINGAAGWLRERFGESPKFTTIAYFGPWDIRYIVLLLAAVKAGFKMVFPSPLYSLVGLRSLLSELDCTNILVSGPSLPVVRQYSEAYAAEVIEAPSVQDLLGKRHPHINWNRTFDEAQDEPLVVLHTSGTTHDPKPIIWTHGWAARFAVQNTRDPPDGFKSLDFVQQGVRYVSMLPVFHCGNLFGNLLTAITTKSTAIFPLPSSKLTGETFINLLANTEVNVVVLGPGVAEQIAANARSLDLVSKKLKHAAYAGGSISRQAGERLSAVTNLFCIYACTENGVFPLLREDSPWHWETWNQIRLHDKAGVKFHHLGDDSYELVVVRNEDPDDVQPVFKLFPHLKEWHSKDVFSPAGEGTWVYRSRIDDVLRFSNGVQFNPVAYEEKIREHPEVVAALMFGEGRPFPVLLVEFENRDRAAKQSLETTWPHIEQITRDLCPAGARVEKEGVVFVQKDRPLPRAYKGTLQRPRALKLYGSEVDAIYLAAQG